jgi:serine O-acetyltransferase
VHVTAEDGGGDDFRTILGQDLQTRFGSRSPWLLLRHGVTSASFRATLLVRAAQYAPRAARWFFRNRLISGFAIDIGPGAKFGPALRLPHPVGIVVGTGAAVGADVTLYQNVTLGQKHNRYPTLGDGVTVFPGTVIVGAVTIGDGAVIGANLFVDVDVPAGAVFTGHAPSAT